jgi:hypothetical protein
MLLGHPLGAAQVDSAVSRKVAILEVSSGKISESDQQIILLPAGVSDWSGLYFDGGEYVGRRVRGRMKVVCWPQTIPHPARR